MEYLKIIRHANLYSPEKKGIQDILIAGEKIVSIDKHLSLLGVSYDEWDAEGKMIVPGFIDRHVHVIGGGGQQGYASMVPDVTVSELVSCGTTTVVGLLGTDGFVKDLPTLYCKVKALHQEGLSAYMLTSYYGYPPRTFMNSVAEDMIYIDKIIGCKIAMSDDRCSFPTEQELLRLINQIRLGGFTSGKGGFLHVHLGNLEPGIQLLIDIAHQYPTLIKYMSPTHMIRTEQLFLQGIEFAKMGGYIDFSTGGTRFQQPHLCIMEALQRGVNLSNISFSSDGHGGVRRVNPVSGEVTYRPAPMNLNLKEVVALVQECGLPLEQALLPLTKNPAQHMQLTQKGQVCPGYDADLCVLDDNFKLTEVFARGRLMMDKGIIIGKGRYE